VAARESGESLPRPLGEVDLPKGKDGEGKKSTYTPSQSAYADSSLEE